MATPNLADLTLKISLNTKLNDTLATSTQNDNLMINTEPSGSIQLFLTYWQDRSLLVASKIKEVENRLKGQIVHYSNNIMTSLTRNDTTKIAENFTRECTKFIHTKLTAIKTKDYTCLASNSNANQIIPQMEAEFLKVLKDTYHKILMEFGSPPSTDQECKVEPSNSNTEENYSETNNQSVSREFRDAPLLRPASILTRKLKAVDFSIYTQRKRKIPSAALTILKEWLNENITDPYPSKQVKEILAKRAGLDLKQVHNWFINARGRVCKKLYKSEKFGKLVEKCFNKS
jgi:hypothetical protein